MTHFEDISKRVGFNQSWGRGIPIPPLHKVKECEDLEQLLTWARFCEGADTPGELKAMELVVVKMHRLKKELENASEVRG